MSQPTIAIVGNPNCGKTALFNYLTGLRQKTGNFAGVTVEKKSSILNTTSGKVRLIDLPGTYSLYPLTEDEHVVAQVLLNPADEAHPDAIVFIADPDQLERHLLLYSQIRDLGFPVTLGISMADVAKRKGLKIDTDQLAEKLGHPVVSFSVRTGEGMDELRQNIGKAVDQDVPRPIYSLNEKELRLVSEVDAEVNDYGRLIIAHHADELPFLSGTAVEHIIAHKNKEAFDGMAAQVEETLNRFSRIERILHNVLQNEKDYLDSRSLKADRILTHKVLGPLFFLLILFIIFQAIYSLAEIPMGWIEDVFVLSGRWMTDVLPGGWLNDMLTEGVLPGLAGVLVFIPQIAILFFLLGILEESGYLSRAIFLFDRFFQRLGMNGRSLIAMISASACAIPAIMSTRSIRSKKERLLTILVTPLISCSARTPVYIVLVGFIVSSDRVFGIINKQGLAFLAFYLLGILAVIVISLLLKTVMRSHEPSFLMLELPEYKWPSFKDVLLNTWLKVKSFVVEAGKVIFVISMLLWVLASYGPGGRQAEITQRVEQAEQLEKTEEEVNALKRAAELETSYAGVMGQWIEPVIEPLGFDWKIGIALITSFAAREVFVSTMATIYSIESEENTDSIRERMASELNPDTGNKRYTPATALSLVVFYIFAMQCMSTLAVVRKETGSWKWPILQFVFMTGLAYLASWTVYSLMS